MRGAHDPPNESARGSGLRLWTFGGLSISRGGIPDARLEELRKALALLAVIAASGESGISRDNVLALLWPESDSGRARASLKQTVFSLRRELEEPNVVRGTSVLRLDPGVITSDLSDFRSAIARGEHARAARLYQGVFLDGVYVLNAPDFEQWVDAVRVETRSAVRRSLTALGLHAEELFVWTEAREHWEKLVAIDPLDTSATLHLMVALARLGDQTAALRRAREHADLTRSELGVEPDPGVPSLTEQIQSGRITRDVPDDWPATVTARTPGDHGPLGRAGVDHFVGAGPAEGPTARTDDSATARPGRRLSRRTVAASLGAIGLLAFADVGYTYWSRRGNESRPLHVVVERFTNRVPDSNLAVLGSLISDGVSTGLSRLGSVQLATSRDADRKALTIRGAILKTGQRLSVVVVIDRLDRTPITLRPLSVSLDSAVSAITATSDEVVAAVSALSDRRWDVLHVPSAGVPSVFDAYRRFDIALQARDRGDLRTSLKLLLAAFEQDSTYATPVTWAVRTYRDLGACDSSVALGTRLERQTMPPADRAYIDYIVSYCHADWGGVESAAFRVLEASPETEWGLAVALNATIRANHFVRADSLIRHMPPELQELLYRTPFEFDVYHALGDHPRSRAHLLKVPNKRAGLTGTIPLAQTISLAQSYAAEGAIPEVERVLSRIDTFPRYVGVDEGRAFAKVALELLMHGYPETAPLYFRRAAQWYDARGPAEDSTQEARLRHAAILTDAGRYAEAKAMYESLSHENLSQLLAEDAAGGLGLTAAYLSDTSASSAALRWLSARPPLFDRGNAVLWRARIEVVRGRRAEAKRLIALALSQGAERWDTVDLRFGIHYMREFAALVRDPEFQALMRPK